MPKYQRPLRSLYDEMFDADMSYVQCEELQEAYANFWATLPTELGETLDLMLL